VTARAIEVSDVDTASRRNEAIDRSAYLYDVQIRHVRSTPLRNAFTYRSYQWLIDLDALPALPKLLRPLARFETRDHCVDPQDDPAGSLRQVIDGYLARNGIDLHGGSIRMLTTARVLGHVFNPLTVYWCHERTTAGEQLACVIAEVHNTYGGRHRYLLRTDGRGRAHTHKRFYVSPFYEVAGSYTMSLPEPEASIDVRITLHPPEGAPFVTSVSGTRRAAHGAPLLRLLLGRPWTSVAVAAHIRAQGIRLYLRGLSVVSRSPSPASKEFK
jgi:DUF1365 family protein